MLAAVTEFVLRDAPFDAPFVQDLLAEWNHELGFTPRGGSTVNRADFDPPDGAFVVAVRGDEVAGWGGVRRLTPDVGELKRLFVRTTARRHGAGRILLAELERRAGDLGFAKVRLDTHAGATAALVLFRAAGYRAIGDYNGNPYASYWFEKELPRVCQ